MKIVIPFASAIYLALLATVSNARIGESSIRRRVALSRRDLSDDDDDDDDNEGDGFVEFINVACKNGTLIEDDSDDDNDYETADDCYEECLDTEGCTLASYDSESEECSLYESCDELEFYELNTNPSSPVTPGDPLGRFSIGGMINATTGYYTTPPKAYCLECTRILPLPGQENGTIANGRYYWQGKSFRNVYGGVDECRDICDALPTCIVATFNGFNDRCRPFSDGNRIFGVNKTDAEKRITVAKEVATPGQLPTGP